MNLKKKTTPRVIDYWLDRGFTLEEAQIKVTEVQQKAVNTRIKNQGKLLQRKLPISKKIGTRTVISDEFKRGNEIGHSLGDLYVQVKCDCGKIDWVRANRFYRGECDTCVKCSHLLGENAKWWTGHKDLPGTLYHRIKVGATKRNLKFLVSKEYLWSLIQKQNYKCALTGQSIQFSVKNIKNTASLDRIDSSIGYIKGNVQWVHKDINLMKHKFSQEYFIQMCKLVSKTNDGVPQFPVGVSVREKGDF